MRTLSFPTAALAVALAVCLAAPRVDAQTAFVLDDPILVADGQRVAVEGAPLRQERFGTLVLAVPGLGTYTIADEPFEGARRAGEFDGSGLVFAAGGVSLRLRSRGPILSEARRPAFVRSEPGRLQTGAAQVRLGGDRSRPAPTEHIARGPAPRDRDAAAEPLRTEVQRLRAELARLAAEREQAARQRDGARRILRADLDRVTAERDALRAERDRAVRERAGLAEAMERARRDAETARDRSAARSAMSQREREEALRLGRELDRLRREVIARDEAITVLTAERDDRAGQIARLSAEVQRLTSELADTRRQRDEAVRDRDEALARAAAPDEAVTALRAETARLTAQLAEARAERDRLAQLTTVQTPELQSREAEMDRMSQQLAAARAQIAELTAALEESEAERLSLQSALDTRRDTATDADALRRERDRLRSEVDALAREVDRLRSPAPTAAAPLPPTSAARIELPGFDFGRLHNPDAVREAIDAAAISASAADASGDVLVLFQTDDTGQVIRTAVPRPVGGGLDALAERIVRGMAFEPARVDGIATGLRSQVLVRFGAGR